MKAKPNYRLEPVLDNDLQSYDKADDATLTLQVRVKVISSDMLKGS